MSVKQYMIFSLALTSGFIFGMEKEHTDLVKDQLKKLHQDRTKKLAHIQLANQDEPHNLFEYKDCWLAATKDLNKVFITDAQRKIGKYDSTTGKELGMWCVPQTDGSNLGIIGVSIDDAPTRCAFVCVEYSKKTDSRKSYLGVIKNINDPNSNDENIQLKAYPHCVMNSLYINHSGKKVAFWRVSPQVDGYYITLFDIDNNTDMSSEVQPFNIGESLFDIRFSPNDALMAYSDLSNVHILNAENFEPVATFPNYCYFAFSPDSQKMLTIQEGPNWKSSKLHVWDIDGKKEESIEDTTRIIDVAWFDEHTAIGFCQDPNQPDIRTLCLYDLATKQKIATILVPLDASAAEAYTGFWQIVADKATSQIALAMSLEKGTTFTPWKIEQDTLQLDEEQDNAQVHEKLSERAYGERGYGQLLFGVFSSPDFAEAFCTIQ